MNDDAAILTPEESTAYTYALVQNAGDKVMLLPKRFGQTVKRLRKEKGLAVGDVEEKTGISASYIYQIERGSRHVPSDGVIQRLSVIYEVPYKTLMAAARHMDQEDAFLYHDQLERAFHYICQDQQFKFGPLVDEAATSDDLKRFVVEMYQHFTGLRLLKEVADKNIVSAFRKIRGEAVDFP